MKHQSLHSDSAAKNLNAFPFHPPAPQFPDGTADSVRRRFAFVLYCYAYIKLAAGFMVSMTE